MRDRLNHILVVNGENKLRRSWWIAVVRAWNWLFWRNLR
jgi:hypothetical protein